MDGEKKRCMLCAKALPLLGGICEPCRERIRREAQGDRENTRVQAEKELRRHGVAPGWKGEKK